MYKELGAWNSKEIMASVIVGSTILMGGRAAEALAFAQRSTGAQGDILQATEIATNMRRLSPQEYAQVSTK